MGQRCTPTRGQIRRGTQRRASGRVRVAEKTRQRVGHGFNASARAVNLQRAGVPGVVPSPVLNMGSFARYRLAAMADEHFGQPFAR